MLGGKLREEMAGFMYYEFGLDLDCILHARKLW